MKCCICGKEIDEVHSNNPFPYMTEGLCQNQKNQKNQKNQNLVHGNAKDAI